MASEDRRIEIKNIDQILRMCRAGMVVVRAHQTLETAYEPGTTTGELGRVGAAVTARMGAKSDFLGYDGFPATVRISTNEEAIHGVPGSRVLQFGDLVSFGCGAYVLDCNSRQWHVDVIFAMVVSHACLRAHETVLFA